MWLSPRLAASYSQLHRAGYAHSVEAWFAERLVGGLFGVALGGLFTSETMFHFTPDAGNAALVATAAAAGERPGFTLWDIQMATDHTLRFGALEISPAEYRRRLPGRHRACRPGRSPRAPSRGRSGARTRAAATPKHRARAGRGARASARGPRRRSLGSTSRVWKASNAGPNGHDRRDRAPRPRRPGSSPSAISGRASIRATSSAVRVSRASAPASTPNAPKARPARTSAGSQSPQRPTARSVNERHAAEQHQPDHQARGGREDHLLARRAPTARPARDAAAPARCPRARPTSRRPRAAPRPGRGSPAGPRRNRRPTGARGPRRPRDTSRAIGARSRWRRAWPGRGCAGSRR